MDIGEIIDIFTNITSRKIYKDTSTSNHSSVFNKWN